MQARFFTQLPQTLALPFALSQRFVRQTAFERAQRFVEPFHALHLRRHEVLAGNRLEPAAPIRERNTVAPREPPDDMFEMLNVLFELVMIHRCPR